MGLHLDVLCRTHSRPSDLQDAVFMHVLCSVCCMMCALLCEVFGPV